MIAQREPLPAVLNLTSVSGNTNLVKKMALSHFYEPELEKIKVWKRNLVLQANLGCSTNLLAKGLTSTTHSLKSNPILETVLFSWFAGGNKPLSGIRWQMDDSFLRREGSIFAKLALFPRIMETGNDVIRKQKRSASGNEHSCILEKSCRFSCVARFLVITLFNRRIWDCVCFEFGKAEMLFHLLFLSSFQFFCRLDQDLWWFLALQKNRNRERSVLELRLSSLVPSFLIKRQPLNEDQIHYGTCHPASLAWIRQVVQIQFLINLF